MAINVSDVGKLVVRGKEVDVKQAVINKVMMYDGTKFSPQYVNTIYDTSTEANLLQNGGFESGDLSGWSAAAVGAVDIPTISTAQVLAGSYSVLIGQTDEPYYGDSILYQDVTIPSDGATLSFWGWFFTNDTITFDQQILQIRDQGDNVLETLLYQSSDSETWELFEFSLDTYTDQTIRITFLNHMDGAGDPVYWYLDGASVIPKVVNTVATFSSTSIEFTTDTFTVNGTQINGAAAFNYGHGGDGSQIVFETLQSLSRPYFYSRLNLDSGVIVTENSLYFDNPTYIDISSTTFIALENSSLIDVAGTDGSNGGAGGNIGGAGIPGTGGFAVGFGVAGTDGYAGSSGVGGTVALPAPAMTFAALSPEYNCTQSASGGGGGFSNGQNGGDSSGTQSNGYMSPAAFGFLNNYKGFDLLQADGFISSGGIGGSSGAGGDGYNGSGGGGGGAGGGGIVLRAPEIVIGSGCIVSAKGGNGGNGGGSTWSAYGNGGGGGGGHGGLIIFACEELTMDGYADVRGGLGGAGGTGSIAAIHVSSTGIIIGCPVQGDAGNATRFRFLGDNAGMDITLDPLNGGTDVTFHFNPSVHTYQYLIDFINGAPELAGVITLLSTPVDTSPLFTMDDQVLTLTNLSGGGNSGYAGSDGLTGEIWWYQPSTARWTSIVQAPGLAPRVKYINLTSSNTGEAEAVYLQDGTTTGEIRQIRLMTRLNASDLVYINATFDPANTITFFIPGDGADLVWNGNAWDVTFVGGAVWSNI